MSWTCRFSESARRELLKLDRPGQKDIVAYIEKRIATKDDPRRFGKPLRADLDAYMERVNERVSGTVGLKLYKGHARVVTRSSPNAIYDASLASFAQSGGLFSQAASPGFIELWSLQSRMAWRLHEQE